MKERIGRRLRAIHYAAKRRLGLTDGPTLVPYIGLARPGHLWLRGRVLEDEGVFSAPHSNSTVRNLWLTFKRYETDEIRNAEIGWRGAGRAGTLLNERDGYFDLLLDDPELPEAETPWISVAFRLERAEGYAFEPIEAVGAVRVVSQKARFAVVSDIDDTIIHTGAWKMLRHWRIVTANSPEARTAFPGVSQFYRALAHGARGPETNPIFYVSSSPWNLFDIFDRFMVLKDIPRGPMFLRNLSSDALGWLLRRHREHKAEVIDKLMEAYPGLPFVLIGDSGQKDATVYAAAARRHPGRILAVHIHDVRPKDAPTEVEIELDRIKASGIPVTLGRTLGEAARVAESLELVAPGTHAAVLAEIAAEEEKPERYGRFPVIVQP